MLDTNIVSYAMRRRPATVLEGIVRVGAGQVRISSLVVAEILAGARRNPAMERRLVADFEGFCQHFELEPWTSDCALAYAEIDAQLRSVGQPIGTMDTLIAAHAMARDAVLVSNNLRHFERIRGLKLENWV